jgi:hypothetical protein
VSAVRPEYGPTLPTLVRERLGVSSRTATALVVGAVAVVAVIALLVYAIRSEHKVVHHGEPTFNVVTTPNVHAVDARPGELMRLAARRGRLRLTISALPFRLPGGASGWPEGLLPLYAEQHARDLDARLDHFELRDEGKAGRHEVAGYQLGYHSGPAGNEIQWRDMLMLPSEEGARDGVLLRLRTTRRGGAELGPKERALVEEARVTMRSLAFGTEQP